MLTSDAMSDPPQPPRARLDALIDWERRDRSAGMRVDTAPIEDLLARLGSPQGGAWAVHVTGSKGKGSVCAWIEAGLRAAGYSTGRYASPHVETLEERVLVDGRPIRPELLDAALERVLDTLDAARAAGSAASDATWFDVLTAAAFVAFRTVGVERWVVECGLGGRLDSTNVLAARHCVLTGIELEHTAVLGPTREAIAGEKAGILWPGSAAVVGLAPPDGGDRASAAIAARASAVGTDLRWCPPEPEAGLERRNRRLAGALLDLAGERGERSRDGQRPLSAALLEAVGRGDLFLPGRLERFELGGKALVLDGAHTAESVALVRAELEGQLPGRPVVVLALGKDKDPEAVLKPLVGWADSVLCSAADPVRHLSPESLSQRARAIGLEAKTASSPRAALDQALTDGEAPWILGIGSLVLVGALRPHCRPSPTSGPRC